MGELSAGELSLGESSCNHSICRFGKRIHVFTSSASTCRKIWIRQYVALFNKYFEVILSKIILCNFFDHNNYWKFAYWSELLSLCFLFFVRSFGIHDVFFYSELNSIFFNFLMTLMESIFQSRCTIVITPLARSLWNHIQKIIQNQMVYFVIYYAPNGKLVY